MDNDYSSERLEYQSGQRNEKSGGANIPPGQKARSCWRGC